MIDPARKAVTRPDELLRQIVWPELRRTQTAVVGPDDCILVSGGFEDRAVEALERLCSRPTAKCSIGLIKYLPELPQNEVNVEKMRSMAQEAGLVLREFVYDRENPSGTGEELAQFVRRFAGVFVDISGMSRLLIVQLLVALLRGRQGRVSVIYAMAEQYPPSPERFLSDQQQVVVANTALSYLSSGTLEIAATPELGSVSMQGETIRLIAFPSFDPAQLTNVIQELQPTYAEFIHGIPHRIEDHWRREAIADLNREVFKELATGKHHDVSTLDYRETLNTLLDIYTGRSMYDRLVIAPTGSKMQTVAVALFRAVLHDVQIVYPTPQIFAEPEDYTVRVRQMYQLDLSTKTIADAIEEEVFRS